MQKIIEYTMIGRGTEMTYLDQTVTYIYPDETQKEYWASGSYDRIEIVMPDTDRIDVNNAKDSIEGILCKEVIVGISSDTGVLVIPEETMDLLSEYGYGASVNDGQRHVLLMPDVISYLSTLDGETVLSVRQSTGDDLTPEQKATVGNNYAVTVTMTVGGETISDLQGEAEIVLSSVAEGSVVYYVAPDGSIEEIPSTYATETSDIDFVVYHFSVYMIVKDTKSINPTFILIVALILIYLPYAFVRVSEERHRD